MQKEEKSKKQILKAKVDLGASPPLKSKKAIPSRSFLSTKQTSSQNLHLRLEGKQNSTSQSSPKDIIEENTYPETELSICSKSTQDLDLKLSSQMSEVKSKMSSAVSMVQKEPFRLNTQDLKLQLEETQNIEDASLHLDASGASDDLKLQLDSSAEDQLNVSSEPQENERFRRDSKSTIKKQRSFISQVQYALTNGVKNVVSQVLTSNIQNKNRTIRKESQSKENEVHKSLVQTVYNNKEDNVDNNDVWLNTTRNEGGNTNNTITESSHSKSTRKKVDSNKDVKSVLSEKGKKRKGESSSTDGTQKRRR